MNDIILLMSRTVGLISDVHSNNVALQIALEQLEQLGLDEILCAGDIVGYGGCPNETISLLKKKKVTCILGNHDFYILAVFHSEHRVVDYNFLPDLLELPAQMKFREIAMVMFDHTKKTMNKSSLHWLSKLPVSYASNENNIFAIHGAPPTKTNHRIIIQPEDYMYAINKYLFPWDQESLSLSCFVQPKETMVIGHSHMQFAHQSRNIHEPPFKAAHPCLMKYELFPIRKTFEKNYPLLINPGSTGQSRDEIEAPGYAIIKFQGSKKRIVTWYRFKYDFDEFVNKMKSKNAPPEAFDRSFWRI